MIFNLYCPKVSDVEHLFLCLFKLGLFREKKVHVYPKSQVNSIEKESKTYSINEFISCFIVLI